MDDREKQADTLARTLYGEARGETMAGKEAVACVVMNRVKRSRQRPQGYWWGNGVEEVCRKPWQFSCWNAEDPNRAKIEAVTEANRVFAACLKVARRAVANEIEDTTQGSTHYHAKGIVPPWARKRTPAADIGDHLFYNDVE